MFLPRLLFLLLIFSFVSALAKPALIRVRLADSQSELEISGQSLALFSERSAILPVALMNTEKIKISRACSAEPRCYWKLDRIRGNQIISKISFERNLLLTGQNIKSKSKLWPTKIFLASRELEKFDVLAPVELNDYLTGVLSSEMPIQWPKEALKAQVIASRSYLMAVQNERKNQNYDVDASVQDQVFQAVTDHSVVDDLSIKKAQDIVRSTQGQYLQDSNGNVLKAFYHADCGGQTEVEKNVWGAGAENTMVAVTDSACAARAPWKFRIEKNDFLQRLKKQISIFKFTEAFDSLNISLDGKFEDFRVRDLVVSKGDQKLFIPGQKLREIMGYQKLKSTAFDVHEEGEELVFEGRGHGHGVGLCQWGSRAWAQQGWKMNQILAHYFPQAKIATLGM